MEAAQTAESIEKLRTQQFNAQIASKALSPLSPALWKQFSEQLPLDLQRISGLTRLGQASFRAAIAEHGWAMPLRGIVLALLLLFPLRMGLRHLGYRYAASERAPDGRLRRTGLAVWLLLVGTVLPGLASLVFIEHLRAIDAITPRLQSVADAWIQAAFVAAFFLSISASTLVPKRPSWRLLAIDDIAAPTLTRYAWGAAFLTWFAMMLNAVDIAARTSAVSTVALDGLIALTYVGLILSVLVTITQQRQRLAAPATKGEHGDAGRPVQRSSWLMFAWLGGHLTVLAALVAALLGYLNFSVFVATQMVWITVVVLATSLLMKFADDLCTWFFSPDSRPGRGLAQGMGLRPTRVEQVGVLLSALLRVSLLLLGLAALTAPFGNASSLLGWTASAAQGGLPVGDTVLKPMAIFRALQHWLVETYLPKTDLDIGARNSISTVARYVGIILSGLWTLAALGIGFEKVALLASALSVGIGFGLQAITQNFVSGRDPDRRQVHADRSQLRADHQVRAKPDDGRRLGPHFHRFCGAAEHRCGPPQGTAAGHLPQPRSRAGGPGSVDVRGLAQRQRDQHHQLRPCLQPAPGLQHAQRPAVRAAASDRRARHCAVLGHGHPPGAQPGRCGAGAPDHARCA